MDTPGSETSSGFTESSIAEVTPADSSPAQTLLDNNEKQLSPRMQTMSDNDDDSDSDISMSADTDDEEDNNSQSGTKSTELHREAPKKRKHSSSSHSPNGQLDLELNNEARKRIKHTEPPAPCKTMDGRLPLDKSLLPAEIWQNIFSFCPPKVLGSLLQVNKSFNGYLDPSPIPQSIVPLPRSVLKLLKPHVIWRISGSLFHVNMPSPLAGKSELDMWRLACGVVCQFCAKQKINPGHAGDEWHPGPGKNGVARIWQFGVLACGSCIERNTTKELELLVSSNIPSQLLVALPSIFFTNECHILPATAMQTGQPPKIIEIAKVFSNAQAEEIRREFDTIKILGVAAVEEWIKGLEERGKSSRSRALIWERWESNGGLANIQHIAKHEPKKVEALLVAEKAPVVESEPGTNSISRFHPTNSLPQRNLPPYTGPLLAQYGHPSTTIAAPGLDSPSPNRNTQYQPHSRAHPPQRQERSKEEVAGLKAARRSEIERRCMLMDPPLTAGVLAHMPSFQAAIQIIQPLTDGAWEVLMPRLLSQRGEAEQRENDRLAQTRVVQERFDERQYQDPMAAPDSKDLFDREWDDVQAPLRERIGGYANETIHNGWNRGNKVNFDNCPKFAADVLIYVRKRFYAELAKDEAAMRATGRDPPVDPPNGPFLRKLVLENMKWVFDTKIKPHTEQYRKELFLCNACEANSKWYGFEGVIQHFAAKHTNALSVGSVVVHWKSEWPEYPPFNPDPSAVSNPSYYNTAASASAPYAGNALAMQPYYGYGGYQLAPVPSSMPGVMAAPIQKSLPAPMQATTYAPNPHGYQETPGSYFGHSQYGEQYSGQQNGPYPPPRPYQDSSHVFQQQQQYSAPPSANGGYIQSTPDYSQQGYNPPFSAPSSGTYPPPIQGLPYSAPAAPIPAQHGTYHPRENNHAPNYNQPPPITPSNAVTHPPQKTEEYKAQLQAIAKSARATWNTINPIKGLPHPVKVYTIIHHLLVRSRASFSEDPPLQMIIDGLSNNKEMRPVRNIHGLACKACVLGLAGSQRKQQKKPLSFPQLLNHFRDDHEHATSKHGDVYQPDWKSDMVELPEISKLTHLLNGPLKDDQRLGLVIEAIPELIATPATRVEDVRHQPPSDYRAASNGTFSELATSQDNRDRCYSVSSGKRERPDSRHELYDQGEYDPSQPIIRGAPSREGYSQEQHHKNPTPVYRVLRYLEDHHDVPYQYRRASSYVDQGPRSPLQSRRPNLYGSPGAREELPLYLDRPIRHRDPDDPTERDHYEWREPAPLSYGQDTFGSGRVYHVQNTDSYAGSRQQIPPVDAAARSRISDIVAQISQQAQQVQERRLPGEEVVGEAGSEDGELRTGPAVSRTESRQAGPEDEAERFLNTFLSSNTRREILPREVRRRRPEPGTTRDLERGDYTRRAYQPHGEPYTRPYDGHETNNKLASRAHPNDPIGKNVPGNTYITEDRPSLGQAHYASGDRHGEIHFGAPRDRSPELVDRRYKLNNVVYRDERQNNHGTYRTPSRYARYESVRLENERARSRSPVYVNTGGQSGYHDERDPVGPPQHQESIYRIRTPLPVAEKFGYERPPRQEYNHVYEDEPRPRSPEVYELVRVTDEQGEYVIRRPIRRDPEPVYAPYEDAAYPRQPAHEGQPIYENPAPVQRLDQAQFEEYDPRHPEPPPFASIRQASRY